MRISLISSYEFSGGAGVAAHRLALGLAGVQGACVRRFVEHREDHGSGAMWFNEAGRGRRIARDVAGWFGLAGHPRLRAWEQARNLAALLPHVRASEPEIINIHGFNQWTVPGLPREAVAALAEIAPVVWTLHDVWPLTGSSDFAGADAAARIAEGAADREGRLLRGLGKRLAWVGPSRWMVDLSRAGYGPDNEAVTIPYGVDTEVFRPMERRAARAVWGLADDAKVVAAVSFRLHDARKGIGPLIEAAGGLSDRVVLLLAGRGEVPPVRVNGAEVRVVGPIQDDRLLRSLYSAADIVAVPSIEDNLPNVMLESLACGTPVAGSAVGGIPDAVRPGVTGWLAPAGEVQAWRAMLGEALASVRADAAGWRARCRAVAESDYALAVQASSYVELFGRHRSGIS